MNWVKRGSRLIRIIDVMLLLSKQILTVVSQCNEYFIFILVRDF